MPPVLIAVAGVAVVGAAGVALGVTTVAAVAFSVATTAALSGVSYLMAQNKAGAPAAAASPVAAPINGQRAIPIAQPIPPRRFCYGSVRVGGAIYFQDNANPYLYIGSALSDGTVEAIDALYFGDNVVPLDGSGDAVEGSLFYERVKLESRLGAPDQVASTLLIEGFPDTLTSDFRQRGIAAPVVRMHWGADATEHNVVWGDGISPTYQIRGVKVYDPREPAHDLNDPTTWEYSDNPALCVTHALTHAWGVALSNDDLDWNSVAEAANVCDELVSYNGEDVAVFKLAGIFQADADFGAQIADMLSSFRGRIMFQNGVYGLVADKARPSTFTVTDDDILEIGEFKHAASNDDFYGAISAVFYDAAQGGIRDTTDVYEREAGGRETSVVLPFTSQKHSAQIIAYRELLQGRDGRALAIHLPDFAAYWAPGKRIAIASVSAPHLNGYYEVMQVDLASPGVSVSLRGYVEDAYRDPSEYLI